MWHQNSSWVRMEFHQHQRVRPPFVQRKTLLDTFITRDTSYWVNRVTLKMDVPFTDHSHIIGRSGKNTQGVMQRTGCHIHFPDSNKNTDTEKSNQVSIAGPLKGVETARAAIRSLAPLSVTFDLKQARKDVDVAALSAQPVLELRAGTPNITILVRPNKSSGQPFVLLRGSVSQEAAIKEAFYKLKALLFPPECDVQCAVSLDIMPDQQKSVLGMENLNMDVICGHTGVIIHYPPPERKGATTFFIRGSLEGVLSARKQIIGFLPISLSMEVEEEPSTDFLNSLRLKHNIAISLKTKRGSESARMLTLRTQEWNSTALYKARDALTGRTDSEEVRCSEYDFMLSLPYPPQILPHSPPTNGFNPPPLRLSPVPPHAPAPALLSPIFTTVAPNVSPMNGVQIPVPPPGAAAMLFRKKEEEGRDNVSTPKRGSAPENGVRSLDLDKGVSFFPDSSSEDTESPIAKALSDSVNNTPLPPKPIGSERKERLIQSLSNMRLLAHRAMSQDIVGVPRVPNDQFCGLGFSRTHSQTGLTTMTSVSERKRAGSPRGVEEEEEARDQMGVWPVPVNGHKPLPLRLDSSMFERRMDVPSGVCSLDTMDTNPVAALLAQNKLDRFIPLFEEQEVTELGTLATLTGEDLLDLGINTYVARRRLMALITSLRQTHSLPSTNTCS